MKNDYPAIILQPGRSRRVRAGHPWVYSNELVMDAAAKALPPGGLVRVVDAGDEPLGVATFNPHSLIACRLLSRDPVAVIDRSFMVTRLQRALDLRSLLYDQPCYRLIHAEADGLGGLVIDRFFGAVTIEANSAGMELLLPEIIEALDAVIAPEAILIKNDSPVRKFEGLELYDRVVKGDLSQPVELIENGCRFLADLASGQKTGWFFDQRDNRAAVAAVARGLSVIDFYSYAGGFALQAARAGASRVIAVDRSEGSLALASQSAQLNGLTLECVRADAFAEMERLLAAGQSFGVVVADPPAFVKNKKELASGAKGYRKMTRLAAQLVETGGFLLVASCSHHMSAENFAEEVRHGLGNARREGRILRVSGAASDHPLHPSLPESGYLKAILLQLD